MFGMSESRQFMGTDLHAVNPPQSPMQVNAAAEQIYGPKLDGQKRLAAIARIKERYKEPRRMAVQI